MIALFSLQLDLSFVKGFLIIKLEVIVVLSTIWGGHGHNHDTCTRPAASHADASRMGPQVS